MTVSMLIFSVTSSVTVGLSLKHCISQIVWLWMLFTAGGFLLLWVMVFQYPDITVCHLVGLFAAEFGKAEGYSLETCRCVIAFNDVSYSHLDLPLLSLCIYENFIYYYPSSSTMKGLTKTVSDLIKLLGIQSKCFVYTSDMTVLSNKMDWLTWVYTINMAVLLQPAASLTLSQPYVTGLLDKEQVRKVWKDILAWKVSGHARLLDMWLTKSRELWSGWFLCYLSGQENKVKGKTWYEVSWNVGLGRSG